MQGSFIVADFLYEIHEAYPIRVPGYKVEMPIEQSYKLLRALD
jgi:hypothetical protein